VLIPTASFPEPVFPACARYFSLSLFGPGRSFKQPYGRDTIPEQPLCFKANYLDCMEASGFVTSRLCFDELIRLNFVAGGT
jgi:hypothetical protein